MMENDSGRDRLAGKRLLNCYVAAEFGGLAGAFVSMCNALDQKGCQVSVALQRPTGEFLNRLSPDIEIFGLGYSGPYSYPQMLMRTIALVRRVRPHVVTSHAWNTSVLAIPASYVCHPRPRIVLFEHTPPAFYSLGGGWRSFFKHMTLSLLYRRMDALVVVSEGIRRDYQKHYGIDSKCIRVIPPPVDIDNVVEKAEEAVVHQWFDNSRPVVLGVGPLYPAKDFPVLLRAFASVCRRRSARLVIVGDGPERGKLEHLASKLEISGDFCILGYQSNPYKYMMRASVLAVSSIVEGFGKVLVEALALGLPVVSTNCHGPTDILENGRYGLLVPTGDSEALARAILHLLDDADLRSSLKTSGPVRARIYAQAAILERIEGVITDVISTH